MGLASASVKISAAIPDLHRGSRAVLLPAAKQHPGTEIKGRGGLSALESEAFTVRQLADICMFLAGASSWLWLNCPSCSLSVRADSAVQAPGGGRFQPLHGCCDAAGGPLATYALAGE